MLVEPTPYAGHGLGRRPQFDPRSRDYPVRAALRRSQEFVLSRRWYLPSTAEVLDQGADGACVGFAVANELRYTPTPVDRLPGGRRVDGRYAIEQIYWPAQRIDPWDGGAYPGADPVYEGTSVLAGIKAAAAAGWYREYRWAFSEHDLALAVSHLGPAVIGIPWYERMFTPDPGGFLIPDGEMVGGHAVLVIGINVQRGGFFTIANSWGRGWADRGRAKISRADMARLLAEDGEACIITGRARPKAGSS